MRSDELGPPHRPRPPCLRCSHAPDSSCTPLRGRSVGVRAAAVRRCNRPALRPVRDRLRRQRRRPRPCQRQHSNLTRACSSRRHVSHTSALLLYLTRSFFSCATADSHQQCAFQQPWTSARREQPTDCAVQRTPSSHLSPLTSCGWCPALGSCLYVHLLPHHKTVTTRACTATPCRARPPLHSPGT